VSEAAVATQAGVRALLEARSLTAVRAGDAGPAVVLDGVSLALAPGTLAEVSGPSGAGKTTLLLALARLLPSATGELLLDGAPAVAVPPQAWRAMVALLPQRAALVAGTVAENLRLPWALKVRANESPPTDEALRDALDRVGLGDVALDRDVARLSVGQAARVALVRTVLTRPRVLLLDEPDASLDDASAAEVARLVGAFVADGGAVVRVSHVRADATATVRYRLEGGKLVDLARPERVPATPPATPPREEPAPSGRPPEEAGDA
jgi:putative ABC transport system ATP-binding protein